MKTIKTGIEKFFTCPEGYQFVDENGNAINATKIVLEKKKKEYPKTYEECCEILFGDKSYSEFRFVPAKISNVCTSYVKGDIVTDLPSKIIPYEEQINILYKLLICRTAYWKIAGDEMGLGKPWEPDWRNSEERRYCIVNIEGYINLPEKILTKWILKVTNKILVFPTEEMRDAFYENFKKEIESCKELL